MEVASRLRDREDWVLVIGADTVVVRVSHCLPCTANVYMDCCVTGTERHHIGETWVPSRGKDDADQVGGQQWVMAT